MKKTALLLALALLLGALHTPAHADFSDVAAGAWYAAPIEELTALGILTGDADGAFRPDAAMTRAEAWTVLARLADAVERGGASAWDGDARTWAMAQGVSDGSMADEVLTREQFMTMLYRWALLRGYEMPLVSVYGRELGGDFAPDQLYSRGDNWLAHRSDYDAISPWARDALNFMARTFVLNGTSATEVSPRSPVTRAQAAKMLTAFRAHVVYAGL